jgi:hypothetical protein
MFKIKGGMTFNATPKLTGTNIDNNEITTMGSPNPIAPLHKPPTKKATKIIKII